MCVGLCNVTAGTIYQFLYQTDHKPPMDMQTYSSCVKCGSKVIPDEDEDDDDLCCECVKCKTNRRKGELQEQQTYGVSP